ncbi:MAG: strawberry notch C-terminal domain-containing protein [Chloracidobacterium sp.]|nr:strawberry notch C-terminal domain-containing protein [Chloracidobacterium sp.]
MHKRIAVMLPEVASTGDSLHAGKSVGNQQRRLHIAAELKWSADKQIQDFKYYIGRACKGTTSLSQSSLNSEGREKGSPQSML